MRSLSSAALGAAAVCATSILATILTADDHNPKEKRYLLLESEDFGPPSAGNKLPPEITADTPAGVALRCHANFAFRDGLGRHSIAIHLDQAEAGVLECVFKERGKLQIKVSDDPDPYPKVE